MNSDTQIDAARTDSQRIELAAAEWLARRDSAAWTSADEAALSLWLNAATAHRVAFLRLLAAWNESDRLKALGAGHPQGVAPPPGRLNAAASTRHEQMLQALRPRRPHTLTMPRRRGVMALAATVAAAALLFGLHWRTPAPVDASSHRTALGQVRTLSLHDGSHVILASNSAIDVRLSEHARNISLRQGEAIFEVAKDASRPFTVSAHGYHAVAVGTRFSVRQDSNDLRVVVTEGTVRLEPAATADAPSAHASTLLPAGSVALVQHNGVLVRNLPLTEAMQMLDWRNGLLVFRDTPLADVAAEFNRYNARKLVIADATAGELRIGGSFRWDNQEGFVRLLTTGFPVSARVTPEKIELHSR